VLTEKEYSEMKNEILSNNKKPQNNIEVDEPQINNEKWGAITLEFKGIFVLIDAEVKIIVNDELHSKESFKKGFRTKVPITEDSMKFRLKMSLAEKEFTVSELKKETFYLIELDYSRIKGEFSDNFKLTENGKDFN
jgi:hypothetical protein